MKNKIFFLIALSLFSFKCFSFDNYYKMLGVPENASAEDIKKGYRKMAMKYHPDRNAGSIVAGEIFKKVQGAYEVLSDSSKRAAFDKQLRMQPKAQPKAAAAKEAPTSTASKAQKYTWESFDEKPNVKPQPKQQEKAKEQTAEARPEAKTETRPEPKAEARAEVKPTPEAPVTDVKTASKVEASVLNPVPEKAPVRNPKLDLYKTAPSCSKGFLGTVIDTLI
ncbi:DnaJ domain-containing protein [Bacteriovorax sp. PP10]|uniref:DnaJ domain-containing protein n=1 Tax=Bacteriovorax antarcticus TaxID=3088717 RepID=A0ABU5VRI8_9BACT|nr:DnaJ domain-containing protein [Bacteriovorax sp. PP10]MEA9355232.1 DnaJ domain-containing protein [Bacteriovorax sp. PP10]